MGGWGSAQGVSEGEKGVFFRYDTPPFFLLIDSHLSYRRGVRGRFFDLFPKDENREMVIEKPPIKKPCYWQTNFVTKSPETHGDVLFSRLSPQFSSKRFGRLCKNNYLCPRL